MCKCVRTHTYTQLALQVWVLSCCAFGGSCYPYAAYIAAAPTDRSSVQDPAAFDRRSDAYARPRGTIEFGRGAMTFSWPHLSRQAPTLEGLDKFMRETFLHQTDDDLGFQFIPFFTNLCNSDFLALFGKVMPSDMPKTLLLPKLFSFDGLAWRNAVLQDLLDPELCAILRAVLGMTGCCSTKYAASSSSLDLLALALDELIVPSDPITDGDLAQCSRSIASCRKRESLEAGLLAIFDPGAGTLTKSVAAEVSRLREQVQQLLQASSSDVAEYANTFEGLAKQQAVRQLRRAIQAALLRSDRKQHLSSFEDQQIITEAFMIASLHSLPLNLLCHHVSKKDKTPSAGVDGSAEGADGGRVHGLDINLSPGFLQQLRTRHGLTGRALTSASDRGLPALATLANMFSFVILWLESKDPLQLVCLADFKIDLSRQSWLYTAGVIEQPSSKDLLHNLLTEFINGLLSPDGPDEHGLDWRARGQLQDEPLLMDKVS